MILLAGIPSEAPLARLRAALDSLGKEAILFDQRRWAEAEIELETAGTANGIAGTLRLGTSTWPLKAIRSSIRCISCCHGASATIFRYCHAPLKPGCLLTSVLIWYRNVQDPTRRILVLCWTTRGLTNRVPVLYWNLRQLASRIFLTT